MNFRTAAAADKDAVNVIRRQVKLLHAQGRPTDFTPDFSKEMADYFNILLRQENAEILVAESNGELTGLACVEYIDRPGSVYRVASRYVHIIEFAVDEKHRRQGIGTALFAFVKQRAEEKGFQRIELDAWAFNGDALKFYQSLGFSVYRCFLEYP